MKVKSIAEFLNYIRELQSTHSTELLYFRGESNSAWELRPSVMREGFLAFESQMLTDLLTRRPDEFADRETAMSQWVLAQHHGLKTRFLDITKNPLIALFFACESNAYNEGRLHIFAVPQDLIRPFNSDRVSIIANFARLTPREQNILLSRNLGSSSTDYRDAMRHLYQLIREEKPHFEENINFLDFFRVLVVEPQLSSARIQAQSGAFLVSAFHRRFERKEIESFNARIPIYAHYTPTVSWNRKRAIQEELRLLNITRETLFPGLDESARETTEAYRQRLREAESTTSDLE